MKQYVSLLLILAFTCFHTVNAMPDSTMIRKSLLSNKDEYGIPNELYELDNKLKRYKNTIEYRLQRNKRNGTGIVIVSVVSLATSGILFAVAAKNAEKAEEKRKDPNIIVISDPSPRQYTVAVTSGILSVVGIGVGIGVINRKPDITPMKQYFENNYGSYLSYSTMNLFLSFTF